MIKCCRICGTEAVYRNNRICLPCLGKANKLRERKEKDYCSRCFEKKPLNTLVYCSKCQYWVQKKWKYNRVSEELNLEVKEFVKQIVRREYNIYSMEVLKIVDYWSRIVLHPHSYWNLSISQQVKSMFDDLVEYANDKNIIKKAV